MNSTAMNDSLRLRQLMESPEVRRRAGVIDAAMHKPVNRFKQFDGFKCEGPDDVMHPDDNGHAVMGGETWEAMSTCPEVRVLIPPGTDRKDAVGLLRKIIGWIESNEKLLQPDPMIRSTGGSNRARPDDIPF